MSWFFYSIWWRRTDSNHRRRSRQIYSLLPLATRELLQEVFILNGCFPNTINQVLFLRRKYGGGGRIRTIEGGAGRFTVCSLWPLGNSSRRFLYLTDVFPTQSIKCSSYEEIWWRRTDSNHRRRSRQIYSLLPLATRELLQEVFILN